MGWVSRVFIHKNSLSWVLKVCACHCMEVTLFPKHFLIEVYHFLHPPENTHAWVLPQIDQRPAAGEAVSTWLNHGAGRRNPSGRVLSVF